MHWHWRSWGKWGSPQKCQGTIYSNRTYLVQDRTCNKCGLIARRDV